MNNLSVRIPSKELLGMRSLNARMVLAALDRQNYLNLEKGYQGEIQFDLFTDQLQCDCLVIKGLLINIGKTYFQIDTVLIYREVIHLIDVKNFEGDYFFDENKFYLMDGDEAQNPLLQLLRCESLFRQLLQKLRFKIQVEAHLVFINPEYTLYQVPRTCTQMIFPTQIKSFIKKLDSYSSKLTNDHLRLAEYLLSINLKEYPFVTFPPYEYGGLIKGILSASCHHLSTSTNGNKVLCVTCGQHERIESAILRSVDEIKRLFPDRKITTNMVWDWCGGVVPKKMIRRILSENFQTKGYGRWFYYE